MEIRKKTGLLAQRPYMLPMSIYENVAYGMRNHSLTRGKGNGCRGAALPGDGEHWDEVKDRLHAPATRLSIGQQQRLCLARGLAVEPESCWATNPLPP